MQNKERALLPTKPLRKGAYKESYEDSRADRSMSESFRASIKGSVRGTYIPPDTRKKKKSSKMDSAK